MWIRLLNMPRNVHGFSWFEITLVAFCFFLYLLYRQAQS